MRWSQDFSEFDNEDLYRLGLDYHALHALSRLLLSVGTRDWELITDEIPTNEFSPITSEQRLQKERELGTSFSNN